MHKGILRFVILLIAVFSNIISAQASDYKGGYIGGKFGVTNSSATGTINAPSASTFAYGVQGRYFQGGYIWDVRAAAIGVGAYADYNSYEMHTNGITYGSRAYGLDAKLGLPLDDWLPYAKIGYGYSTGTRDLGAVAKNSLNAAIGVEYKLVSQWGAIVEYKKDGFSNKDGSILIRNRTLSFGLNYYFDRPEVAPTIAVSVPVLDEQLNQPELDVDLASEPPPDIGSSILTSVENISDSESWKRLLDNNTVRIEGSQFLTGSVMLESGVVTGPVMLRPGDIKELKEVASFAGKYPDSKLELTGYADNIGSEEFNQRQSLARAESVRNYLVANGVAANRISTKGAGPINPIGDNNTYDGRTSNRRVEIRAIVTDQRIQRSETATPKTASAAITSSPAAQSVPETWKVLLQDKPILINIKVASVVSGSGAPNSKIGKELDEVVGYSRKYPETMLELVGYTDSSGSELQNLKLSLARAESITKYLVKKGVPANRISTKGEGSANPVGDNNTKEGRAMNRRVEIRSVNKVWKTLLENKPVSIENTNFVSGTSKLKPEVGLELGSVVGFADKYPDAKLEIIGYSDTTNPALSLELADSVRNYLAAKGVASNRITIKGEGSANPVADNKTKAGRTRNRRVEIRSIAKEQKISGEANPVPMPSHAPAPVAVPMPVAAAKPVAAASVAVPSVATPAPVAVPTLVAAAKPVAAASVAVPSVAAPAPVAVPTPVAAAKPVAAASVAVPSVAAPAPVAVPTPVAAAKPVAAASVAVPSVAAPAPVAVPTPVAAAKPVAAASVAVPSVAAPAPVAVPTLAAVPKTWKLLQEEKPVLVNIEGTSFDSGSGRPNSKVVEELDEVVGFADKYPDTKLELSGYTDTTGSAELNQELSFARAESVKKYLVKKGVSANRITTIGKGSANPVGNNKTKEGRAKNRRVEIHSVIKDEKKSQVRVVPPTPTHVTDPSSGLGPAKPHP